MNIIQTFLSSLIGIKSKAPVKDSPSSGNFEAELKDWYVFNRTELNEEWCDARKSLDQALLTLSSAGLAIGVSISQISTGEVVRVGMLLASWLAFAISILLTLFSFLLKEWFSEKALEELTAEYIDTASKNDISLSVTTTKENWSCMRKARNFAVNCFSISVFDLVNFLSLIAFIVGLTTLSIFSWKNLTHRQIALKNAAPVSINKTQQGEIVMTHNKEKLEESKKPIPATPKPTPKPANTSSEKKGK
jgi:hypothetical protein